MTASEAFVLFVKHALVSAKAARFAALAANKRGQRKIVDAMHHKFELAVRPEVARAMSATELMNQPCYVFSAQDGFGAEFATVREAYDHLSVDDGWLIL